MNDTSSSSTESQQPSTKNSWNDKTAAVLSVSDLLAYSKQGWLSSMTIGPSKSGGLPALTVTGTSSEGTETHLYSGVLPIILIEGLVSTFLGLSSRDEKGNLNDEVRTMPGLWPSPSLSHPPAGEVI